MISIKGWIASKAALVGRSGHRETYSIRDLHAKAVRVLQRKEVFQSDISTIEDGLRDEHESRILKLILAKEKDAEEQVDEIISDLHHMCTDAVIIFHFTLSELREIIGKDAFVQQSVPDVRALRESAVAEFQKIEKLKDAVGAALAAVGGAMNPFAHLEEYKDLFSMAAHRKNFPIRDMYRDAALIFQKEKDEKKAMKNFREALKKHILPDYRNSHKKVLESIAGISEELHHIGIDLVAVFHSVIQSLREIISTNEKVRMKLPDVNKYLDKQKGELIKLIRLANQAGKAIASG